MPLNLLEANLIIYLHTFENAFLLFDYCLQLFVLFVYFMVAQVQCTMCKRNEMESI